MAWIARDGNGTLCVYDEEPVRYRASYEPYCHWKRDNVDSSCVEVPGDADEKLIGRHISWADEAVEI